MIIFFSRILKKTIRLNVNERTNICTYIYIYSRDNDMIIKCKIFWSNGIFFNIFLKQTIEINVNKKSDIPVYNRDKDMIKCWNISIGWWYFEI